MGFKLTPVVKAILIINLLFFIIGVFLRLDLAQLLGLRNIYSSHFQPFQFLTHMFIHQGFWHLFYNMFALIIFGPLLEHYWDSKKFATFYLITGLGASALYAGINHFELSMLKSSIDAFRANPNPDLLAEIILKESMINYERLHDFLNNFTNNPSDIGLITESKDLLYELFRIKSNIPMVGASGAVFGILMAFGMTFPNMELQLLIPPIPIKAKYLVAIYACYEVFRIIQNKPDDNVAHFAHMGGMLFAFILLKLWKNESYRF